MLLDRRCGQIPTDQRVPSVAHSADDLMPLVGLRSIFSITFGSPTLVQSLTNANLVDEYRIIVHPLVVDEGKRLFDNIVGRKDLKLSRTHTFEHGAMLVCYELVKA